MSSSSSSQTATERVYRVAYVETNRDVEDIRFTFAQCGEMFVPPFSCCLFSRYALNAAYMRI